MKLTEYIEHYKKEGWDDQAEKEWRELQEDAEKYKRVDDLFTELEIPLPYDLWLVQSLHIREHLKKFFNAENVLTKSEYKQKILGEKIK